MKWLIQLKWLVKVGSGRKSERTCGGRIPDTGRAHDDVGMKRRVSEWT